MEVEVVKWKFVLKKMEVVVVKMEVFFFRKMEVEVIKMEVCFLKKWKFV